MLPVLPISDRWVGPGRGHVGHHLFPSAVSFNIAMTWAVDCLVEPPGEMDTVVFGVSSALNSLQSFTHSRKDLPLVRTE